MFDLTGFQRDLLWVIASLDAPSGQEILEAYVRSTASVGTSVNVGQSRLYPNLNTLVDKGLVTKSAQNQRANTYEITELGRTQLIERRRWERSLVDVRFFRQSWDS